MRTLLVGDCKADHLYRVTDPSAPTEAEFEFSVAKALTCLYPDYHCIVFGGGFLYERQISRPDLALVARDYSHWFVLEVELLSHSLYGHVMPQVKAFQYGVPQADCIAILSRKLSLAPKNVETFLRAVPRQVAVIANGQDAEWRAALRAHDIQMLSMSVFRSEAGVDALEVQGVLDIFVESLGFGAYSATDRSLRISGPTQLPLGEIQIATPDGSVALWTVTREEHVTWITKNVGSPLLPDGAFVQILRAVGGRLSLRLPLANA